MQQSASAIHQSIKQTNKACNYSIGINKSWIKGAIPQKSTIPPFTSALNPPRDLVTKISKLGAATKHTIAEPAKTPMSARMEPTLSWQDPFSGAKSRSITPTNATQQANTMKRTTTRPTKPPSRRPRAPPLLSRRLRCALAPPPPPPPPPPCDDRASTEIHKSKSKP